MIKDLRRHLSRLHRDKTLAFLTFYERCTLFPLNLQLPTFNKWFLLFWRKHKSLVVIMSLKQLELIQQHNNVSIIVHIGTLMTCKQTFLINFLTLLNSVITSAHSAWLHLEAGITFMYFSSVCGAPSCQQTPHSGCWSNTYVKWVAAEKHI